MNFYNSSGNFCESVMENTEAVKNHFSKVFNISSFCNDDVLNSIVQRKIRHELDDIPDNGEIAEAIFQAKHDKACDDSGIAAEFW